MWFSQPRLNSVCFFFFIVASSKVCVICLPSHIQHLCCWLRESRNPADKERSSSECNGRLIPSLPNNGPVWMDWFERFVVLRSYQHAIHAPAMTNICFARGSGPFFIKPFTRLVPTAPHVRGESGFAQFLAQQ